jgi:hypothetical protein
MASLVSSDGTRFELAPDRPTRIGRGSDNALVIPDKSVSRHHATITVKEGRFLLRDLESANGTFRAGGRISDAFIADGDRVRFGDIEFTLDDPGAKAAVVKPWWQSRLIQASAATAIGAVILVGLLGRRSADEQAQSSGTVVSAIAGRSNFDLPQASPDFVGDWSGSLPMTSSNPPKFSPDASVDMGVTFYTENGRVVLSIATYAPPGMKVTKMTARGVDDKHVMLGQEALEKDTLGQPLWERDRIEIALTSSSRLDCTEIHDYFRDRGAAPVAEVVYTGPMRRISEAETQRRIEEMERKGLKKQGETRAPVLDR